MPKYIVELQQTPFMWLAAWGGDPGRTMVKENAKRYRNLRAASKALADARWYSDFPDARLLKLTTVKTCDTLTKVD